MALMNIIIISLYFSDVCLRLFGLQFISAVRARQSIRVHGIMLVSCDKVVRTLSNGLAQPSGMPQPIYTFEINIVVRTFLKLINQFQINQSVSKEVIINKIIVYHSIFPYKSLKKQTHLVQINLYINVNKCT